MVKPLHWDKHDSYRFRVSPGSTDICLVVVATPGLPGDADRPVESDADRPVALRPIKTKAWTIHLCTFPQCKSADIF